jgi:hypothetical protein
VNKKAWMTAPIFSKWLKDFNLKVYDRKELLLIDNAPSHANIDLSDASVHFYPVIRHLSFTAGRWLYTQAQVTYKTRIAQWLVNELSLVNAGKKLDVMSAINVQVKA